MRALLRVKKIDSYIVSIFSGDHRFTKPEWPSLQQFNHAILAISVPEDTKLPAAFTHPKVGRMLLFDPTDPDVPFGFLPQQEQGALALLLAGEKGSLFPAPTSKPTDNHLERKMHLTVDANGGIKADFEDISTGQEAFDGLSQSRNLSKADYRKALEGWLGRRVTGSKIETVETSEADNGQKFQMKLTLSAESHVRMMQGRLMMLKPAVLGSYGTPNVTVENRKYPLVIQPVSFHETVEVTPPANFAVDEIPDPIQLKHPFGTYKASWVSRDGKIFFERTLLLDRAVVEPADYKAARDFFMFIYGAENNPVVLVRR